MYRMPRWAGFGLKLAELLCVAVLATGCSRNSDRVRRAAATAPARHAAQVDAGVLHPSLRPLKFVGRVALTPSGQVQYAWSGAGFRARFSGRGLSVHMDDSARYHTVVVDGQVRPRLETQPGARVYQVVENLTQGEHVVELYRRTEAFLGTTTLIAVEVTDGQLLSVPTKAERHIEIIGDSISCGYGNEGSDTACSFSPETENHYLTYGSLLARRFGAELSTIAWSGRGLIKNFNGGPGDPMPLLYERILPERPEVTEGLRLPADLVIVNLGTNDFSTEPDPSQGSFVAAYVGLLAKVRREEPDAHILTTIGPMLAGEDLKRAERYIRQAVESRTHAGDTRVQYHPMKATNDNPGCDWHPNLTTHEKIAQELEVPIARLLKW